MSSKTSVIIPVLNGENFISEALSSVLDQLSPDDEIIVVDDGSTDGTADLLEDRKGRLKVLAGPGRGPSAARNVGIGVATGEFVAFLDHDDLWPPGRHQALLRPLKENASVDAAAGRIRIRAETPDSDKAYLGLDGRHAPPILMSCLYRRSLIERVGPFDDDMRFGEDLNYYVRLAEAGMRIMHCDHDSLVYRRHACNATNSAPSQKSTLMNIVARKVARARRRMDTGAA